MLKKVINKYNLLLTIIVLIPVLFTVYLALNIKMGISPDSWYHLKVSEEYSTTLTIPPNTPDTYQWRDITNIPYLYFWVNGRILNINDATFHFDHVILLRFINIIYSIFTIIGVYLLSKEVIQNKLKRLLPVVLLGNTLMFLFLSSSINYDNLGHMFATYAIYFFIMSVKNTGKIQYPLLTLIMLCLGTLTKFTILPLAAILFLLLLYEIFKHWNTWSTSLKKKETLWILPVLIFGILNILLYGSNILKYKELIPSCEKILTNEQCLQNGVYLRDTVWIPEVQVNIVDMIKSGERLDPIRYTGVWVWEMSKKTIGIMGDQNLYHSDTVITIFVSFIYISILIGLIYWKKYTKEDRYLLLITGGYLLILIIFQNYDMYLKRGYIELALHGRYMFPVISSLYVILSKTWLNIQNKNIRYILIFVILLLMILSCIPFFLVNVDRSWLGYTAI